MIEPETGYNTDEQPQPGECYCHLMRGQLLCQTCLDDLVHVHVAEAYGPWAGTIEVLCTCEPETIKGACPACLEREALEVAIVEDVAYAREHLPPQPRPPSRSYTSACEYGWQLPLFARKGQA